MSQRPGLDVEKEKNKQNNHRNHALSLWGNYNSFFRCKCEKKGRSRQVQSERFTQCEKLNLSHVYRTLFFGSLFLHWCEKSVAKICHCPSLLDRPAVQCRLGSSIDKRTIRIVARKREYDTGWSRDSSDWSLHMCEQDLYCIRTTANPNNYGALACDCRTLPCHRHSHFPFATKNTLDQLLQHTKMESAKSWRGNAKGCFDLIAAASVHPRGWTYVRSTARSVHTYVGWVACSRSIVEIEPPVPTTRPENHGDTGVTLHKITAYCRKPACHATIWYRYLFIQRWIRQRCRIFVILASS